MNYPFGMKLYENPNCRSLDIIKQLHSILPEMLYFLVRDNEKEIIMHLIENDKFINAFQSLQTYLYNNFNLINENNDFKKEVEVIKYRLERYLDICNKQDLEIDLR